MFKIFDQWALERPTDIEQELIDRVYKIGEAEGCWTHKEPKIVICRDPDVRMWSFWFRTWFKEMKRRGLESDKPDSRKIGSNQGFQSGKTIHFAYFHPTVMIPLVEDAGYDWDYRGKWKQRNPFWLGNITIHESVHIEVDTPKGEDEHKNPKFINKERRWKRAYRKDSQAKEIISDMEADWWKEVPSQYREGR